MGISPYIIIGAALVLASVFASKISDRFGIPVLLLFLVLGMLAGSEGPGGIYFDDPDLAQSVGVIALVLILFSGGLSTEWREVRPVLREGVLLATIGVFITAGVMGLFASAFLDRPLPLALLLAAIVSSTDAAAVFAVLRSKGISLRGVLKPLLELESGSNDPMAIFLTVGMIQLIQQPDLAALDLVWLFVRQMLIGAAVGYVMARGMLSLINRLRLGYEGLYPVLSLALVLLTFGLADVLGGSGFLSAYLAGVVLGNHEFIHRRSLLHFHDGLAWLMQITLFLTLGLLVFPSRLAPIAGTGLLLAGCLALVARPMSVFIALLPSKLSLREKLLISWVGLRGAAPILLATFPLLAGIPEATLIFNVVFFVVLTSVLLQGPTIAPVARLLGVDAPVIPKRQYPIEYAPMKGLKGGLKEIPVARGMVGKAIFELGLPEQFLVVLIARGKEFLVPKGGTVLEAGDTLLVLSDDASYQQVETVWGVHDVGEEEAGSLPEAASSEGHHPPACGAW